MTTIHIRAIDLFERDIPFTHPFRFGAITVDGAAQAYIRVQAEIDGRITTGASAELLVPKWFDKSVRKSPAQTVDDLRRSLALAADSYRSARGTAFAIHADRYEAHIAACARENIPPLAAAFGPAELDKAVLDALFRAQGVGAWQGLAANLAGLDARLTPDLDDRGISDFLRSRRPATAMPVRHAVGFLDDLARLPGTLAETGCRFVKIKLSGDLEADRARLAALAAILPDQVEGAGLDANEQYTAALLPALVALLDELPPIRRRLLYLEQPLPRGELDLGGFPFPCVLDEGDDSYDAFPSALAAGWRGVSSKSCKGTYKALLNAIRAERAGALVTAEDLTTQPGLALQQDTALAAFLALPHMERNGHCYTAGFADPAEAAVFAAAHPDLYDGTRLRLSNGALPTGSIGAAHGYGSATHPDWTSLQPLKELTHG